VLKLISILFLVTISVTGFSQNFADKEYYLVDSLVLDKVSESDKKLLDSCLTYFHQADHDTNKLKVISTIIEASWDDKVWPKYNLWIYHFTQKKLNENPNQNIAHKYSIKLAAAINNIGYYHSTKGNISEALDYYEKGLKLQQKLGEKKGVATSLNNIGTIYKKQGDIPNALEYYHKSLKIYKEIDHTKGLGQALNNIGTIYQEQEDPNLALEYFHRGYNLYKKIGDKRSIATILNNIGHAYFKKENISKALDYYNQSIAIRETLNDYKGIATIYNNIAALYENQHEDDQAIAYYLKSIKIYKNLDYKLGISASSVNLGRILYRQGKLLESKKYIQIGFKLANETGSLHSIKNSAMLLSYIYEDEGKGMKALKMHKLYLTMRDSINNEVNQKALIQQHAKYQYQKEKAIDDAERDNLIAIEQKEKEKQTIISYATAFGLILVLIFSFFVFNRLKVAKKQKILIEIQNKEIVDSINYAKRIQEAILPTSELINNALTNNFIYYRPKDIVAGDFYWMETIDSRIEGVLKEDVEKHTPNPYQERGLVLFAVADCTGHGVSGAMVSVVCNNALNSAVREYSLIDPAEILNKTREIVAEQFNRSENKITTKNRVRDGMDIALCSLELNSPLEGGEREMLLKYAGAYNPLWIIRDGSNTIEEIKANRQAIGNTENPKPFQTHRINLNKGDSIFLFSDGFSDQFGGGKGKKMMKKRFKELLISLKDKPMGEQQKSINTYFENWRGEIEQVDDVCVMGVRV